MVIEDAANMAASILPTAAKECVEARLAARISAVRAAPDTAKRGLVRAVPLSKGLFDQEAIDRVFISLPTVIQINQQPPPR